MLLKCVTAAAIAAVWNAAWAQQSQPATFQALSQINRLPWPHIGSPPSDDDPQPTKDRWRGESAAFDEAFRAIRGSWAGPEVTSPGELRARVEQYEALIKSVTRSGGYGNILLADCLRRLSLTLLATYEIRHPGDRPVGEVLRLERVSILDSAAMEGFLREEFKLAPPPGGWRLAEDREQVDSIFRSQGTTVNRAGDRMLFGLGTTSALIKQRDVYGLLFRLFDTEAMERVSLPGLVEFHRRGGRSDDLDANNVRPYLRVMEPVERQFRFAPLGITMFGPQYLAVMEEQFGPGAKAARGFTKAALE